MTGAAMTGHCLCGAVTITVAGMHDPRVGACHCRMCQRWSGTVYASFMVPAEAVTVSGEVKRHRSSSFSERAFCPGCGSHLWMCELGKNGEPVPDADYELMPGLFDAAADWPLHSEIYVDRAMASMQLLGAHRRMTRSEYEADNPFVEGDAP